MTKLLLMRPPAIQDGLLFIADCGRKFHCLEAGPGKALWTEDIQGEVWASPLVADGKVYLGTRSGAFYIFAASQDRPARCGSGEPRSGFMVLIREYLYLSWLSMNRKVLPAAQGSRKTR